MRETYHIEVLGEADGPERREGDEIQQRISVRAASLEEVRARALALFARARVPQRTRPAAQAVRVIDGAGTELFRWSRFDTAGP